MTKADLFLRIFEAYPDPGTLKCFETLYANFSHLIRMHEWVGTFRWPPVHGLPHMDYQMDYPRKRKERNITPSLLVLIEFTDPPSCCFHFVFITAAQMVAGAILRHDGWHAGHKTQISPQY